MRDLRVRFFFFEKKKIMFFIVYIKIKKMLSVITDSEQNQATSLPKWFYVNEEQNVHSADTTNFIRLKESLLTSTISSDENNNITTSGANLSKAFIGEMCTGRSSCAFNFSFEMKLPILDVRHVSSKMLEQQSVDGIFNYFMKTPDNTIIIFRISDSKFKKLAEKIQEYVFEIGTKNRTFIYVAEKENQIPTSVPGNTRYYFPETTEDKLKIWSKTVPEDFFQDENFSEAFTFFSRTSFNFRAFSRLSLSEFDEEDFSNELPLLKKYFEAPEDRSNSSIMMNLLFYKNALIQAQVTDNEIDQMYPKSEFWRRDFSSLLIARTRESGEHVPKFVSHLLHRIFPIGTLAEDAVHAIHIMLQRHYLRSGKYVINMFKPCIKSVPGEMVCVSSDLERRINCFTAVAIIQTQENQLHHGLVLNNYQQLLASHAASTQNMSETNLKIANANAELMETNKKNHAIIEKHGVQLAKKEVQLAKKEVQHGVQLAKKEEKLSIQRSEYSKKELEYEKKILKKDSQYAQEKLAYEQKIAKLMSEKKRKRKKNKSEDKTTDDDDDDDDDDDNDDNDDNDEKPKKSKKRKIVVPICVQCKENEVTEKFKTGLFKKQCTKCLTSRRKSNIKRKETLLLQAK
jgi:hypothetical protein